MVNKVVNYLESLEKSQTYTEVAIKHYHKTKYNPVKSLDLNTVGVNAIESFLIALCQVVATKVKIIPSPFSSYVVSPKHQYYFSCSLNCHPLEAEVCQFIASIQLKSHTSSIWSLIDTPIIRCLLKKKVSDTNGKK